jgi:hypothetical protein
MKFLFFKKIGLNITSFMLVCAIGMSSFALAPQKVTAISVVEVGPSGAANIGSHLENISTAISTAAAAVNTYGINYKEWFADPIFYAAVNLILHQMSQEIVRWINSGFQGKPAFVTNLKGFMLGIADRVAGEYIWGSQDLQFLCSPFKLDIKIALDIQYKQSRGYNSGTQCKLTDVIKNVQGIGNSLSITNWNQWFEVTTRPENNAYGSLLMAQLNLSDKVQSALGVQQKQLDFGKGFLSKEVCDNVEDRDNCRIVTPGTVIEDQLNLSLGSGQRRIELADEVNEIVAALFGQLVKQAFAGVGGLLGLTQSGYGEGSGTYYAQLASSTESTTMTSMGGSSYGMQIELEKRWSAYLAEEVLFYKTAEAYKESSCLAGTPLSSPYKEDYKDALEEVTQSTTTIDRLTEMESEYNASIGRPNAQEVQNALTAELAQMRAAGLIHTQTQLQNFAVSLTSIRSGDALNSYKASVDRECRDTST